MECDTRSNPEFVIGLKKSGLQPQVSLHIGAASPICWVNSEQLPGAH